MPRKLKNPDRFGSRMSVMDTQKDTPIKAPDMSKIDVGSTPKLKMSFGEAFRAARQRGDKTFTWDGKPGTTFTTKMASDKPAAPKPAARSTTSSTPTPSSTSAPKPPAPRSSPKRQASPAASGSSGLSSAQYEAAVKSGVIPSNASAEDRANLRGTIAAMRSAKVGFGQNTPAPKSISNVDAETANFRVKNSNPYASANMKKGGAVKKMAKGGSIDGIAQRGKTRCKGAK